MGEWHAEDTCSSSASQGRSPLLTVRNEQKGLKYGRLAMTMEVDVLVLFVLQHSHQDRKRRKKTNQESFLAGRRAGVSLPAGS